MELRESLRSLVPGSRIRGKSPKGLQPRNLFAEVFPDVQSGGLIDFSMFGRAIAEFEFSLIAADAPIDRFARGQHAAMSIAEKEGALVFFGKGKCVACHASRASPMRCSAIFRCM